MSDISVCGYDCDSCGFRTTHNCGGCNTNSGKVFHTLPGNPCQIYRCCKRTKKYSTCLECEYIPCALWRNVRDPRFLNNEPRKNFMERMQVLIGQSKKQD